MNVTKSLSTLAWSTLLLAFSVAVSTASAQSGRCQMTGFVVGESDYPGISGATVELIGERVDGQTTPTRLVATTDSVGKYSLEEIPHGEYTLRVTAAGYSEYEIPICMLSDTTTQLHVRLRKLR
jgi:hypothetical protein